jgi:hypothetical protein
VSEATKSDPHEKARIAAVRLSGEKAPLSLGATTTSEDSPEAPPRLQSTEVHPRLAAEPARSHLELLTGRLVGILILAAVLASAVMLLVDAAPRLEALFKLGIALAPRVWTLLDHSRLSALPLLLAGSSYIGLQALLRPTGIELLKRLMLGGAFLLWGIVQLMPPSPLATSLGDLVISMYVLDLGLIIQTELQRL